MSLDIKVPSVGESITEVTIANWHKKDGDSVNVDDVLCELESDKATFELNAESAGILRIVAREGETVPIGGLICRIEEGNGAQGSNGTAQSPKTAAKTEPSTPAANPVKPAVQPTPPPPAQPQPVAQTPAATPPPAPGKVVEMKVPAVGESIAEVTIGPWQKKDGDQVQQDEVLCEIESDKATFELTAEASGTLRIVAKQGETLPIGALICRIEPANNADLTVPKEPYAAPKEILQAENQQSDQPGKLASNVKEAPIAGNYATGHASPSAAKILAEKGIDAKGVQGTGPDGRIIKADAMNAQQPVANNQPVVSKAPEAKPAAQPPAAPAKATAPQSSDARSQRRQKMTSLRKTIARRLVAVKNETAMLTTFNEVDMKPIMDLRAKYKDKFKEKHNVGLGFMSFFAKACCVALQEWPAVNAMIDGDEMVFNDFCDISVAVSTPKGLVVPVIRNAQEMSFAQIEAEIIRLATRARDGKLGIEEMTGGTFTITNGGVFGSMMSTPIINAPQSAILGMHNIVERPVAVDGQVVIRPMMYVALSYDHRIIDGRESVSFLVRVKQLLEDPMRLLLEV
jgi:2-oxoglutarate dehydrogenase E2 component (dihydrolipoamide succinyltransferase)